MIGRAIRCCLPFGLAAGLLLAGGTAPALAQLQRGGKQAQKRAQRQGIVPQTRPQRPSKNARSDADGINNLVMRLMQMPSERRQEFFRTNERFRRMPSATKSALQNRLRQIDRMPDDERELLLQRYQLFTRLPQTQQSEARRLYGDWQELPRERRQAMTQIISRLRQAEPAQRERMLGSDRFAQMFSKDEQKMVRQLLGLTAETDR